MNVILCQAIGKSDAYMMFFTIISEISLKNHREANLGYSLNLLRIE